MGRFLSTPFLAAPCTSPQPAARRCVARAGACYGADLGSLQAAWAGCGCTPHSSTAL